MSEATGSIRPIAEELQAAGFWIRTRAYLIDAILLALVGGAPLLFTYAQSSAQQTQNVSGGSGLISFLYFVFFWSHYGGGRTIGMRVFGLRVVQEDGRSLGLREAVIRYIGLVVSFLACFAGVLWVARDVRHQGWHDKLARTLVVRADKAG
jgi:uncharacterized RDD family membrane protein YckC